MSSLTDAAEGRVSNFVTGNAGATAPTGPLKLRLMTANGSDSAAGTEVAGGSYTPQTVTFTAGAPTSNDSLVRFEGIANPRTIVGVEVWDSAGTPFRWMWAALSESKVITDGVLEFDVAALTFATT